MTRRCVLDASAALRLLVGDGPIPTGVESAIAEASSGTTLLLVPELFWIEVTQVVLRLERRQVLSADQGSAMLADLGRLPCQTVGHQPLLSEVAVLARRHGLSAYDATYLALAAHHGATLLTADAALARAAG